MSTEPDQPDGVDEYSNDLPDPLRAANRVNEFLAAWGDGRVPVDCDGMPPLFSRDLQALTNVALGEGTTDGRR